MNAITIFAVNYVAVGTGYWLGTYFVKRGPADLRFLSPGWRVLIHAAALALGMLCWPWALLRDRAV